MFYVISVEGLEIISLTLDFKCHLEVNHYSLFICEKFMQTLHSVNSKENWPLMLPSVYETWFINVSIRLNNINKIFNVHSYFCLFKIQISLIRREHFFVNMDGLVEDRLFSFYYKTCFGK